MNIVKELSKKIDVADMDNMPSEVESDPLDDFIDGTF